jgi:hypothetical protein
MAPPAAIDVLRSSAVQNLRSGDRKFAESLLGQYDRRGKLSQKQWPYVTELADKARNGYPAKPKPATQDLGSFQAVFGLLQTATANLKYPKVRLHTEDGNPVVLGVAGPRSQYAGQINVTDGGPYGANRWYGRIDGDGNWTRSRQAGSDVEAILVRLGDDPVKTAADHGKLTGRCCFCNRHLEDEKSTDVGYGPVCAKNFELPWGNK